jgi:hypothetical protein
LDQFNTDTVKSFWSKPEGKVGIIVAGLLAVGGFVGFGKILPFLVNMAQNTLTLMLLLGAIAGIVIVVADPKFRLMISSVYKLVMKKVTGMIIEIDPINILKNYLRQLYDNIQEMNKQIGLLKGQMRNLKKIIDDNEAAIQDNLAVASKAKELDKKSQQILKTRKASRLQNSNMTYKTLYTKMEVIYRILSKMYENCGVLYEDTEDQIKQKEVEWNVIRQSYKAIKSAMSVVNGNADQRAMFEQTLDFMATDLGNKIGEMERFMETSQNFMDGVDLQNGVFEEKGLKMLEEWEKNADSFILGDDKDKIVKKANDPRYVINVDEEEVVQVPNEYFNLFNK